MSQSSGWESVTPCLSRQLWMSKNDSNEQFFTSFIEPRKSSDGLKVADSLTIWMICLIKQICKRKDLDETSFSRQFRWHIARWESSSCSDLIFETSKIVKILCRMFKDWTFKSTCGTGIFKSQSDIFEPIQHWEWWWFTKSTPFYTTLNCLVIFTCHRTVSVRSKSNATYCSK